MIAHYCNGGICPRDFENQRSVDKAVLAELGYKQEFLRGSTVLESCMSSSFHGLRAILCYTKCRHSLAYLSCALDWGCGTRVSSTYVTYTIGPAHLLLYDAAIRCHG